MADNVVPTTLPELDDKQKLAFREMQLEMSRFQLQNQTLQQNMQTLSKRMSEFVLQALAGVPTEGVMFDQNTLTFSYTQA